MGDLEKHDSTSLSTDDVPVLTSDRLEQAAREHDHFEKRDGRYILDPEEARLEFGNEIASSLKLSKDGRYVLWPQPLGPEDPQSWSEAKKRTTLIVAALAAFVPDFSSGVGIASLFNLAAQFETTPYHINNLTSNWSIFLLGPGGVFAVILARRFGRLPVMFWSQVFGLAFMIGCTFAPNLATFAGMRCLQAFFSTAPQVTGLYVATDIFPVHRQSRAIALWTLFYICSPFMSPWLFGYLCARQSWRWAYGAGSFYILVVVLLITFLLDETMYDRHLGLHKLQQLRSEQPNGIRYRFEKLVGITGFKLRKYRTSFWQSTKDFLQVLWRPHFFLPLIFVMFAFGFTIGINVTNPVFLATPKPIGFGLKEDLASTMYMTPIVGALIGEILARFLAQASTTISLKRNHGVLESEDLLLPTIPGICCYVLGMCLFGWANLKKESLAGVIFGWGFVEVGTVIIVVSVLAKSSLDFPGREGEISALVNLARVLGGFAVPYFETIWAEKAGTLVVFGAEGGIVAGLWLLSVPTLFLFGKGLRERFSIKQKA